jgi:hypothetical protein
MIDNPRWSCRPCPGVPGLIDKCNKKLRTRSLCESCTRTAEAGRIVKEKLCIGVPSVAHTCMTRVRSKLRCNACEKLYIECRGNISKVKKEQIERNCLRCDKKFMVYNKFVRLCKSCGRANSSSEFSGLSDEHYSINVKPLRNGGRS